MGYSEPLCQICGVSFNISRIRKASEPLETAIAPGNIKLYVELNHHGHHGLIFQDGCSRDTDKRNLEIGKLDQDSNSQSCMAAFRHGEIHLSWHRDCAKAFKRKQECEGDDNSSDSDYNNDENSSEPENDDDDDDDFSDSDNGDDNFRDPDHEVSAKSENCSSNAEIEAVKSKMVEMYDSIHSSQELEKSSTEQISVTDTDSDTDYQQFLQSFRPGASASASFQSCNDQLITISRWRHLAVTDQLPKCPTCDEILEWEHIAGPQCESERGYSGYRITFEEMRLCNVVQCLMLKDDVDWSPEEEDEPFEREGQVFLTGVAAYMPSRDMDYPSFTPIRHGRNSAVADNVFFHDDLSEPYGMPFHPSCFEVYKRASLKRQGRIDIEGLINWWILEATYIECLEFPRSSAVYRGREQWWQHNPGDEYLAANPCFVAELKGLLQAVTVSESVYSDKIHTDQSCEISIRESTPDKFSCLPTELILHLLKYLNLDEISCVRQVSSTFRRMPQFDFMNAILTEKPWLWEAWCDLHYSYWSTTSPWCEEQERVLACAREDIADLAVDVLKDDEENQEAYRAVNEERQHRGSLRYRRMEGPPRGKAALTISHDRIDWCSLTILLDKGLRTNRLKGLRNRARIFDDCNEILDRIERYREEGKILPGVTPDWRETVERCRRRL